MTDGSGFAFLYDPEHEGSLRIDYGRIHVCKNYVQKMIFDSGREEDCRVR